MSIQVLPEAVEKIANDRQNDAARGPQSLKIVLVVVFDR